MKWNLSLGICVALICALTASVAECKAGARLIGIVNIPEKKFAVVEMPAGIPGQERITRLQEGQRLGPLEVVKIDTSSGTVETKVNGTNLTWKLKQVPASGVTGIALEDVELDALLSLYAEMADRTVLHAGLPKVSVTINFPSTNRASVSSALTNALKQNGIVAVLDGEKFVIVVPESLAAYVKPHSSEIKSVSNPQPPAKGSQSANTIPAGMIDFPGIPLPALLPLYSELAGAKGVEPDANSGDMAKVIALKTHNAMSKEEVLYALDTILALDDIKLVRTADNKIKVVKIGSEAR